MNDIIKNAKAIIMDLDGTIIDAFEDVVEAVNITRRHYGLQPLEFNEVVNFIGKGPTHLLKGTLPDDFDSRIDEALDVFKEAYRQLEDRNSRLFDGVIEFLDGTEGKVRAILTNKLTELAKVVLDRFGILDRFDLVIGYDTTSYRKPDPKALVWVLGALRVAPHEAVYIGDSVVDADTAKGAGVPFILVKTGLYQDVTYYDVAVTRLDELLK